MDKAKKADISVKDTILQHALELFAERGYDAVGVNEIAVVSGITKPTLYYYFKNKEGVYRAIWETFFGELFANLKFAACYIPHPGEYDYDVYPVLKKVAETYFDFAEKNAVFYRLVMAQLYAPETTETSRISTRYMETQHEILRDMFVHIGAVHGSIAGKENRFAVCFISLINSFVRLRNSALDDGQTCSADAAAKQFMHGIFTP